ncbi:NAD(P)-dependent dehydrogenase, short-chain alcohol dehydrogenase family [Actinopolymorpha cephalotaxi]|uniref:NAD(P)-dependent dehydrogenase (Short-subunit alcohol dehydrogenase family) n=1 Tax=Actinopolymorpha cephalotaxi TaxID=504797 RepID=A0A1I2TMP5_9ACTN|nr:3-oxoacyl-ACP reductase family protein [Actinopolymorpha cephalotaxi]NYH83128.1 NAD(P)-dependent dehydrogenase (short-subunit alcohol dehydrogenase family) [Actinopolymorpha cephalotaxi]SFG65419.1 NAD(P)-dependent dehydrogenase, short-chain alcohol dehydrogenase family [Actinopolymorpha cephalotaxi]
MTTQDPTPKTSARKPDSTRVLDRFSLDGKVALVTGASRGLGRAMAQALGEAGAAVAVTARGADGVHRAAEELRAQGIRAYGVRADVTDPADVDRMVAEVTRELGPVDVLVNNAGISVPGTALETPEESWREVLATNLDGVWRCSRAVAAGTNGMVERGSGTIVNIGSMSAMIVNQPRWQPPYLASKAAVHQLTKALAAEWAPHGIRVNALAPGYFLTEASPVDQPEYQQWCVEPAAMKRYGLPDELGPAVVFLASDASSFMTGSVVVIDGGFTLF